MVSEPNLSSPVGLVPGIVARLVAASVRGAWLVIVAALALTVVAGLYAARNLTINSDTRDMIDSSVPFRQNDNAFDAAFPQFVDFILVVIDGPSPERVEFAARRLEERIRAEDEVFRTVYRPGSEAFFQENGLLFLSVDELGELADRLAAAQPFLGALVDDPTMRGLFGVLELALSQDDPSAAEAALPVLRAMAEVAEAQQDRRPRDLSWQGLLGGNALEQGRALLVVQPELDFGTLKPAAVAIDRLRALSALVRAEFRPLEFRLTGPAALDQEELEAAELGGREAGILSLVLVSFLLTIGVRSVVPVIATALTLIMGLIWTAAFATLTIGALNIISVAFAVLFIGLGVDFGIHFSLRHREEAGRIGNRRAALTIAGGAVAGGLVLSAVSAAAGFYSFLPTDYRGLAELGLIAGSGMFIALFANLTVLPALLSVMPMRIRGGEFGAGSRGRVLSPALAKAVAFGALAVGLAALAALPMARFDFNPLNLKDPNSESTATFLDLIRDPNVPVYAIDILADDLAAADAAAAALADVPAVEAAVTLSSFVPDDQDEKLAIIDDLAIYMAPALGRPRYTLTGRSQRRAALDGLDRQLAIVAAKDQGELSVAVARLRASLAAIGRDDEALAFLEGRLVVNLPAALERLSTALMAAPVAFDDLPETVRERWLTADGRARVQVIPAETMDSNEALTRFVDSVMAVIPDATGTPVVISQAGKAVVAAFLQATVTALVLITLILALVLRTVRDVMLVLAPLAFAAVMTVAAAVVLGLPFNFANIIALPLLLGLGVSAGIHLVLRWREMGEADHVLASSTPRAVLFSALTTAAAFGSLALSDHRGMNSMGQLLTIAIACTLLAMLVLLPALLALTSRPRGGGT